MDAHFRIIADRTPNNYELATAYFCIPFKYYINEIFNEKEEVNDTYLSIEPIDLCKEDYSEDLLNKINNLTGKKIVSINDLNPYIYLEKLGMKGMVAHSSQARYIILSWYISKFNIHIFPFKKEELTLKIKFDGIEEEFYINYTFKQKQNLDSEFREYYLKEQKKYFKFAVPFPTFEKIELNYKIHKGLTYKNNRENDIWDLEDSYGSIKCKIDNENNLNVLYQNSFLADDYYDYENTMYRCFEQFYSNDYKIIIIEDQNGGGYTELCIPFTQYVNPHNNFLDIAANRATDFIKKNFFYNDENIDISTCKTYTEKDDILDGEKDMYSDEVIHNKTKYYGSLNVFEKKITEIKRRAYLAKGKYKKPTEIIVFTDGLSFSCTSTFIKGIQANGGAIIAGYNIRPDLINSKIDASQSSSGVETFDKSEIVKNLQNLGYSSRITFSETFDPNYQDVPNIPNEFLIGPVDLIVNIYNQYNDSKYNRFIKEAKKIFDKYNKINGECNPDNKYLYYETDECDSKLNITHAHGGYICGSDGKWNTNKCIASYCDIGYILNDNRTKCLEDPCNSIKLNEIIINEENEIIYKIKKNNIYIFKIENQNYSYSFNSNIKYFFYIYNDDHILEPVDDKKTFKNNEKIFVNYYLNITEDIEITIKSDKKNNNIIDDNNNDENGLPTTALVFIIIGSVIILIVIFLIIYITIIKKKQLKNDEIEGKNQNLV